MAEGYQENPHSYSVVTVSSANANVTDVVGGYVLDGKVVTVSVKMTFSANIAKNTNILNDFYYDLNNRGIVLLLAGINKTSSCRTSWGKLYTNDDVQAGEYWLTGSYIAYP